jgi:2-polyprenyl-6-methoxyphenol hydroxylase-like FAD-dependent oxidoreductase
VGRDFIKLGDAVLATDPLSASGVQRAMQGALAAAVTVNTILRRPDSARLAEDFYRERQADIAQQHGVAMRRAVPHADLAIVDPYFSGVYITRNFGYLVYDTLFGMDRAFHPQPEMVDSSARFASLSILMDGKMDLRVAWKLARSVRISQIF